MEHRPVDREFKWPLNVIEEFINGLIIISGSGGIVFGTRYLVVESMISDRGHVCDLIGRDVLVYQKY